jgi:hypothetical protein
MTRLGNAWQLDDVRPDSGPAATRPTAKRLEGLLRHERRDRAGHRDPTSSSFHTIRRSAT